MMRHNGKRFFWILAGAFAVALFFVSCEMPDTKDELDNPIPAVWAVFSPDRPAEVYITKVVPFGVAETQESSFVHDAELTLSWDGGQMTFAERDTFMSEWGTRWYYLAEDTSFRVEPGRTYTLSGVTSLGNFTETFTVPNIPQFEIFPDTANYDGVVPAAFIITVDRDDKAYEYEITFEDIVPSREFLPDSIILMDCYDLRWLANQLPDTVVVPWCKFYYATTYEVRIIARERHLYDFMDYYYYYDEDEQIVYTTPGGDGYVGVIGAYSVGRDTVVVTVED